MGGGLLLRSQRPVSDAAAAAAAGDRDSAALSRAGPLRTASASANASAEERAQGLGEEELRCGRVRGAV